MAQTVKIISVEHLTHDVLRITSEKPEKIHYRPGQAADISINKPGWEQELRSFTFTSLPEDPYIECIIKTYPAHRGVTGQLLSLAKGDEWIIHEVFGDIAYKGTGMFIAGGAGVTPFIAILKHLEKRNETGSNKLIFANKTRADIILEKQLRNQLGRHFINILSDEKHMDYRHGFVSAELIREYMDEHTGYFYLCGPDPMMQAVEKHLSSLGIEESRIIKEAF